MDIKISNKNAIKNKYNIELINNQKQENNNNNYQNGAEKQ